MCLRSQCIFPRNICSKSIQTSKFYLNIYGLIQLQTFSVNQKITKHLKMCLLIVDWPIKKWSPRQAVGGGNLQIGFKVVEVPPPSLLGAVLILRGTPLNLPSSKHPHPTPLWNFLPHPRGMMTKWPGSATKSWTKFDNKCSNEHWNTVHKDILNGGMIKENHFYNSQSMIVDFGDDDDDADGWVGH